VYIYQLTNIGFDIISFFFLQQSAKQATIKVWAFVTKTFEALALEFFLLCSVQTGSDLCPLTNPKDNGSTFSADKVAGA